MSFGTILDYTYNRNQGVKLTILSMGFLTGDKKGHTFRISIVDKKGDVDLSGASVTGWFIPNDQGLIDDLSVPLKGSVDGNKAILSLPAEAYLEVGRFNLVIKLNFDGDVSTIFWGAGNVSRSNTDSQIDVGNVIPSLEDLLAQIERIESAIATAQQAASKANESATKADASAHKADESSATADASAANANTSALNANSAVENVNAAVLKIDGMTVSAEKADKADAVISEVDGAKHIAFKLPKGDTGATPAITFEVETGAAGTNVLIDQSGTAENPVVKLTIPRGDTGAVDGVDYYEGTPNALGTASSGRANGLSRGDHVHPMPNANDVGARPNTWMPSAEDVGARPNDWMPSANDVGARPNDWMPSANDVGALPSDGTAADASKLGGKTWAELMLTVYPVGSIYMSVAAVSPETLFGGTWEQLKDRFLLGSGDSYENESTGGEASTALEVNHLPPHDHETYSRSVYSGGGSFIALTRAANAAATDKTGQTGSGEAHNNMPPYLVVNMWKRVA